MQQQQYDAALALLSNGSQIDPEVRELAQLAEAVCQERAAAERNAHLAQILADMDDKLARGEWSAASDLLSAAAALQPDDPRVRSARQRVDLRRRSGRPPSACCGIWSRRTTPPSNCSRRATCKAPEIPEPGARPDPRHPRTIGLVERVESAIKEQQAADAAERRRRTVDQLLREAAEHLTAASQPNPRAAVEKVTQVLALVPDHAGALELKVAADAAVTAEREAARVSTAIRNARARFANGKHQAAIQLLEGLSAPRIPSCQRRCGNSGRSSKRFRSGAAPSRRLPNSSLRVGRPPTRGWHDGDCGAG